MRNSAIHALLVSACLVCTDGGARADEQPSAKDVLRRCDVSGGLLVYLGCGDGRLTAALRANERCLVHGLDGDREDVTAARRHIASLGIYGPVSVMQWDRPYLPYRDNMVNLLFSEDPGNVDAEEIMRVLAPLGTAYVKRGGQWKQTVKPWPEDIGEWTHWLQDAGNNPVARDMRVGPPNHMQWKCGPLWSRSHDRCPPSTAAMVSAKGRLFYIYDEGMIGLPRMPARWTLIARDAFNGLLLWKLPLGHSDRWRLVAAGDSVFVALDSKGPLSILDAATGEVRRTCEDAGIPKRVMHCGETVIVYSRAGKESHVTALDPETGRLLHEARVRSLRPDVSKQAGLPYDMEGTRTDILVGDGEDVFAYDAPKSGQILVFDADCGERHCHDQPPLTEDTLGGFRPTGPAGGRCSAIAYAAVQTFASGRKYK